MKFFIPFLFFFLTMQKTTTAQTTTLPLNEGWKFKAATPKPEKGLTDTWLPITCPGLAHTGLLQNGIIEDPFYRDNETKLQWLENENWVFENHFDVPLSLLENKHLSLIFEGVDTHADIFLNSELIQKTDNAFRSWEVNIRPFLKEKDNILRVFFYSPIEQDEYKKKLNGYGLPGGDRVFSRKAQYNYGWDWGPRLVSSGFWRPIEIKGWNEFNIVNLNIKQLSLSSERAIVQGTAEIEADAEQTVHLSFLIDNQTITKEVDLIQGKNIVALPSIIINNPKVWWTHDLGEQPLYSGTLTLLSADKTTKSEKTIRIGLRTIELVRDKDNKGETFYFRLNGRPVFAKGANYIPQDIFQDRVKDSDYEKLLTDAIAANMNMLRVWGGGIYENDIFYDLCDEKGLLVWQDFMYACAMYPGDKDFLENITKEAVENVRRLRHHPSMALWCGNNENNEAWHNWGWQEQLILHPRRKTEIWANYQRVFNDILPTVVREHSNSTSYWESSPSYSRYNPKSDIQGDSHYWGVWHDEEPFEAFEHRVPRFMSEYGFQSFPEWKTIVSFTKPIDRDLETDVMKVHQKHPRGNPLIRKYMEREYIVPKDFENFVYVSQLLQADGMRRGIEAHRRAMPYCMGSLYWQLNDVWQVASWSGIDNFGHWKALHYRAKEAFAPVLLSPHSDKGNLKVTIVSDLKEDLHDATLRLTVLDFYGKTVYQDQKSIKTIKNNTSSLDYSAPISRLAQGQRMNNLVVQLELFQGDKRWSEAKHYFLPPLGLLFPKPTIEQHIRPTDNGYIITLKSDRLAKSVYLQTPSEGHFSNNYFDLLPNEVVEILFKTTMSLGEVTVKTLGDTY
ncbi:MAG: Exo-beta-D-glucosaminidase [Bacteroidota bacterium]|jgi:beta-mannosidase